MGNEAIDAALLSKMFLAGARNLEEKKDWINELNVFPVPDGDTGTNMHMTMMSAAKEVSMIEKPDMITLSKAIASGSLRGARGNSGVILSQLFRGFTKVIEHQKAIDKLILCEALEKACETAYKAVMKPKEGTILTVARGISDKALELVGDENCDLEKYIILIIDEAEHVLSKTPDMLPVLKQAGVVDSGGQGLLEVLKGARDVFLGKEADYTLKVQWPKPEITKITPQTEAEIKFGYCTEFIIVLGKAIADLQKTEFQEFLKKLGDSIVFVSDDEVVKVHIHTNNPGQVLEKALIFGSLSRIKIDNMREEHQEKLFRDAQKSATGNLAEADGTETNEAEPEKEVGFISISVGEGMAHVFRDLGVDALIEGGQTMNPSTEDILNAIQSIRAKNIFLFPNNKNIIMAANQAALLTTDKNVIVIPTQTMPQGITAMIHFVPEQPIEENRNGMLDVIKTVKTGQVTYAVRDTSLDGKEIHEGDYMGIGDSSILSVGKDRIAVTEQMVSELVEEDSSIICIYYGADSTREEAEQLAEHFLTEYPFCEVEIQHGGQPVYYYIISVE